MTADHKSILEVRAVFGPDSLLVEWGMQVEKGKFLFPHKILEVRLYCDPFPDFGRPELMNSPLPDRSTISGISIPLDNIFSLSREVTRAAFSPGTVFSDPDGRCYPVSLDLTQINVPAVGVIAYPAVKWPVAKGWLDTPRSVVVRFGASVRGKFVAVAQYHFTSKGPDHKPFVLPDVDEPVEPEV